VKAVLQKEECDILILDEIMAAINTGLIDVDDVADVLRNKPSGVEIILTGRDAPDKILELADYVSHNVCKSILLREE